MATATGNISSPKGCDKDNEELNKMANGNMEQRATGVNQATRSQIRMPFQRQAFVRFPDVVQRGIACCSHPEIVTS
jgi:hypothetical protein